MIMDTEEHKEYKIKGLYTTQVFLKVKNIMNNQIPFRLFLFQHNNNQTIEDVKNLILQDVDDNFYQVIINLLTEFYFNCQAQFSEHENTYLNKENNLILFLLNIKIEVNILNQTIIDCILPIPFQSYFENISNQTRKKQVPNQSLIFGKISLDFEVDNKQIDHDNIKLLDWRQLLYQISQNPINQKNQNYLNQFLKYYESTEIKVEPMEQTLKCKIPMEKQPNQLLPNQNKKIQQNQNQDKVSTGLSVTQQCQSLQNKNRQNLQQQFEQLKQNDVQTHKILIFKIKFEKSLIRQQNQEILISKCSNSYLPLGKDNLIFYNQKYDISLQKEYNKRILYTGQLNYNYEPEGIGFFQQIDLNITYKGWFSNGLQNGKGKQTFLNQFFEGLFNNGLKQGCFKVTEIKSKQISYCQFEYDLLKYNYKDEQHFNQEKQRQQQSQIDQNLLETDIDIVQSQGICLKNKTLQTLKVGVWLQDSIIDYYILELQKHYKQLHQDKVNYTIFNVMNSQDIFSSQLNYQNFDYTQLTTLINLKFLEKQLSTTTLAQRTIFAMNLNRYHFITIVIEDNQIYILNSIQSDLSSVCKIMKESFKQLKLEIDYHPEEYQIKICQQNNHYSCGVHTCYVIHQLIKNYNQPIKQIKFNNTEANIEKYTTHMRNVILTKKSIHIETQIQ